MVFELVVCLYVMLVILFVWYFVILVMLVIFGIDVDLFCEFCFVMCFCRRGFMLLNWMWEFFVVLDFGYDWEIILFRDKWYNDVFFGLIIFEECVVIIWFMDLIGLLLIVLKEVFVGDKFFFFGILKLEMMVKFWFCIWLMFDELLWKFGGVWFSLFFEIEFCFGILKLESIGFKEGEVRGGEFFFKGVDDVRELFWIFFVFDSFLYVLV